MKLSNTSLSSFEQGTRQGSSLVRSRDHGSIGWTIPLCTDYSLLIWTIVGGFGLLSPLDLVYDNCNPVPRIEGEQRASRASELLCKGTEISWVWSGLV
ncbi:hypothetical protein BDW42DRAFT_170863 [Aspergillus taichungensis]|uniref:Uncharacterized protein n=1 Tax=Aspergillus taichungensis TaxID=482145 RepID=A0A2J5HT10_9EURO|nr:hypothetical protein BDW42DRAFT_170863 [Aspergillus taichungensis]